MPSSASSGAAAPCVPFRRTRQFCSGMFWVPLRASGLVPPRAPGLGGEAPAEASVLVLFSKCFGAGAGGLPFSLSGEASRRQKPLDGPAHEAAAQEAAPGAAGGTEVPLRQPRGQRPVAGQARRVPRVGPVLRVRGACPSSEGRARRAPPGKGSSVRAACRGSGTPGR